ncbi:hypothetical protein [Pseudomonas sp. SID14000]|uniref:hypothetical protein n=1 Tax=Pseudomonas sp. SID14000 TaxID=1986221 RepID=UPI001482188B|nr:hypothetical protein [Pseudomonas sp. SID14000]
MLTSPPYYRHDNTFGDNQLPGVAGPEEPDEQGVRDGGDAGVQHERVLFWPGDGVGA